MTGSAQTFSIIAVCSAVTILLRALPFAAFRKRTPKIVLYLGTVLPAAIMDMLAVYCLRNVQPLGKSHALPELLSVLLVIFLHKWRHNTLLSILCGTLFYMFLIQVVFIL